MNSNYLNQQKRHILLGLAVDVSGSMKQSIRNQNDENDDGFKAFRNSLKDLSKKLKKKLKPEKRKELLFRLMFLLKHLD